MIKKESLMRQINELGDIMITGGAGYFGRALIKRLLSVRSGRRICIYSRDEAKQAALAASLGDDPRLRYLVGDVRDLSRLQRAMRGVTTVIHAAALKRIEVGWYCPGEMVATNVTGTQNVVDAAQACGARRVVLLSTDKACRPISPYGYTKALAEAIFRSAGPGFSVVRYGNVAGSTGSVIPTWRAMIAAGAKAVPVSDPDCTRFWMWAREAVDLVLQAAIDMPGEILTPKLPAYRLGDLAEAMGVLMDVKGLPPWEKRHEQMVDESGCDSLSARRLSVKELKLRLRINTKQVEHGL